MAKAIKKKTPLDQRLDKIEDLRKQLKSAEKSAIGDIMDMLKQLMKDNPMLKGFRWQQYAPGFNDGEPCEFGIHGPDFLFDDNVTGAGDKQGNSDEEYEDEDEEQEDGEWINGGQYGDLDDDFFEKRADILNHKQIIALKKAVKDANRVFDHLAQMEDEVREKFGESVQVVVSADGVEVEDYDCGY